MADPKEGISPPEWKLNVIKWLGLFPVILVVSYTTKFLGIKPLALKLFVETLIIVPLLSYVVTPKMDDWFSDWLYRGTGAERDERKSVNVGR